MRAWFAGEIAAVEFDEGERRLALNPAMPNLHRLYQAGQGIVVYAVASPYRERSHRKMCRACGLPTRCSDEAPPPPLALTVAERRGWHRLKYSFNGHAKTQQLVVTAGQPIDLEPHRQTVARKPRGNAQRRRTECRTGKRIP
jgi:hypothetical protein